MKQYESSTATLREILSDPSLQHDKVEETMDAMAEASAQHKEIDDEELLFRPEERVFIDLECFDSLLREPSGWLKGSWIGGDLW